MGRTTFTNITPLPPNITRDVVIEFLHDHLEMIDLNPLIIERHTIPPPPHAAPEEHRCVWYSLTDRISYLPGVSGKVTYTCAFNDLPEGLQTHCYAAMGLDIRDRWSIGGSLPGEPSQPLELGLNAPLSGLYLREDVDLRCSSFMAGFVKKTIKKAHGSLVDRLSTKAQMKSANQSRMSMPISDPSFRSSPAPPSLGSDSLTVSPIGPLFNPNSPGAVRGYHARSHSVPPVSRQPDHQPDQPYRPRQQLGQEPESPYTQAEHKQADQPYRLAQQLHQDPEPPYKQYNQPDEPYTQVEQHHYNPRQSYHQHRSPSDPFPAPNGGSYGSNQLGVPQIYAGDYQELPETAHEEKADQGGGLKYSGTVYRGSSKPQDYTEFSDMNPFEKTDPTLNQQLAPEANNLYPAPLQVSQDRRVTPAELQ